MPVFLIIVGIVVVIFVMISLARAAAERERQRIAAVSAWAQANDFSFSQQDPFDLDARFNNLADIGRGHSRYAFEILSRQQPVPSFLFRYHFATTETRTVSSTDGNGNTTTRTETYEQDHWRTYVAIDTGGSFPDFFIRPEGWGDKVKGLIGFEDINFESEEFSRKYFCKSDDRQFAYALIHPQMIEWMMNLRLTAMLNRGVLMIELDPNANNPAAFVAGWNLAAGFINRIPPFVWTDYGKKPAIQITEAVMYQPVQAAQPVQPAA